MYIITRKGEQPSMHQDLRTATQEAVKTTEPPCWIWRLSASRLGTLKRIEVPREDIQRTGVDGLWCIRNRSQHEDLKPADGQLYIDQNKGQVLEYRRNASSGKLDHQVGRFVREAQESAHLTSPQEVSRYLMEHIYHPFDQFTQEEMWVLLLNSRNKVTHEVMVYRGQVNNIHVRVAELFSEAVRLNSPMIIVSHNHPTGETEPSTDDLLLTSKLRQAAKLLDIQLCDHLIIGKNSWVSLKERGFIDSV